MSDAQLKDLLNAVSLNNDRESFKMLYFNYYQKLFCMAKSLVKSTEGAEEIVDDTFLSIWQKRADLIRVNNITFYLYMAVRNKSLNYIAKRKAPVHLDIDELEIDIADVAPNAEDQLLLADLTKIINETIAKLPEQCKLVFKLIKEDGLKYREVAELLNLSVKTVEYHIGNALKKLAESLNQSPKKMAAGPLKKIFTSN
jgi:RNA polymerase sigma-70 factor (ECF subfamily)